MAAVRGWCAMLMSKGIISHGWYSILTGAAMLYVARGLWSVRGSDAAAPFAAVVLGITGVSLVERGIRFREQAPPQRLTDSDLSKGMTRTIRGLAIVPCQLLRRALLPEMELLGPPRG